MPSSEALRWHFIAPGKPSENVHIDSFNGTFRYECPRRHWFTSPAEACTNVEYRRQATITRDRTDRLCGVG